MEDVFRDANDADRALIYLSTHGLLREEEEMVLLLSDGESEEYLKPEKLKQIGQNARDTIPVPWEKVLEKAVERYERLIALGKEGKLKDKRKRML